MDYWINWKFRMLVCKRTYHVRDGNYCPNCGAKMDGGNDNG